LFRFREKFFDGIIIKEKKGSSRTISILASPGGLILAVKIKFAILVTSRAGSKILRALVQTQHSGPLKLNIVFT
jgi:hypothetical protein